MVYNNVPNSYLKNIILICQTNSGSSVLFNYPPDHSFVNNFNNKHTIRNKVNDNFNIDLNNFEDNEVFQSDIVNNDSNSLNNMESSFKELTLKNSIEKDFNNFDSSDISDGSDISTDYADYSSDDSSILTNEQSFIQDTHTIQSPTNIENLNSYLAKEDKFKIRRNTLDGNSLSPKALEYKTVQEFIDKYNDDNIVFTSENFIAGLEKDIIAEYCIPPRHLTNQKFEFTCDELSFVGLPISLKNNETFKKEDQEVNSNTDELDNNEINNYDSIYTFNLVFLMNPPLIEYDQRVDDVYENLCSKFAIFLRFVQNESNYLNKELFRINKINESFEYNKDGSLVFDKYKTLLMNSSLCRAITKCFHRITDNKIANLVIDDDKFISLQIPLRTEFSDLPNTKIDNVLKGSFLTSIKNQDFFNESLSLEKELSSESNPNLHDDDILNYALVFLMEPDDIIQDLKTNVGENDLSTLIMTDLVKIINPQHVLKNYKKTMRILIQQYTNETFGDEPNDDIFITKMLKSFILHFLYWRQARCILPISSKNKYIVSPLAPIKGKGNDDFDVNFNTNTNNSTLSLLYQHQSVFNKKFPLLPPFSKFLTFFNGSENFGIHIPSKEHKSMYFKGLGWCLKKGFLTQILTFVYLRVDSKIKMYVEEDIEKEGYMNKVKSKMKFVDESINENGNRVNNERDFQDVITHNNEEIEKNNHSDNESFLSIDSYEDQEEFTIILDPITSSAIEKRWLYKLVENDFTKSEQKLYYRLLKYFNGKTSIEYICLKHSLNKAEVNYLLKKLGKYVVKVKHW
ncbi:hypothetical protein ACO0R3_000354 [Hanseniaspora guilliermondii]